MAIAPPDWITDLALSLVNLINYGITIVIIMLIVEFAKLFGGTSAGSHMTDWKKSPVLNAIKRGKKKWHVGQLNEAIVEEKELQLVENVLAATNLAKNEMDSLTKKTELTQKEYDEGLGKHGGHTTILTRTPKNKIVLVGFRLQKAINYFRRVKKKTWRQQSETGTLISKLEAQGEDISGIVAKEKKILVLHKETKGNLLAAMAELKKVRAGQVEPKIFPVAMGADPKFSFHIFK
jgi:hypothetical protein